MPINYDWRGNIKSVSAKTVADAKQTIQELRFKNREYAAQKKEVSVLIAQVRSHGRARIAASRSTTLLLGRSTDRVVKNSIKASKDIIQMQTNNEIRIQILSRQGR